ncbi:unnamed protein product [Peronospora farinosa]|uniref:TPX2 C-terminal domain-containing protein n=1 Tax=Peronospora farinosa TaxID=134698 RepID=A0AAV0UV93_9STRA|nr:unnamed protein product [Peronospora farinosa]CAI5740866.1 unnamed protein product [Peronospora farinosa]
MATLLDTTMEASKPEGHATSHFDHNSYQYIQDTEPETDAPEDEDDDDDADFQFNAPSYYDLKNPALEQRYVNNADGYFSSPAPSVEAEFIGFNGNPDGAKTLIKTDANCHVLEIEMEDKTTNMMDTTMTGPEEEKEDEEIENVLNRSNLLEDREESFEEVFRRYASSSQSSATSSYLLQDVDTSMHSSTHGHFSPYSSQTSSSSTTLRGRKALTEPTPMNNGVQAIRSTKNRLSGDSVTSKLMQPTQSYLRRLQAEQRMREQSYMDEVPAEEKPHRVTRPRSPKMHSKTRTANPNDPSRMSSTSRELLKIQEERLLLQLEKLKIREFHEKIKVQQPPTNVHQRSTKQLTIPQTPHFEVDNRARRLHGGRDSSVAGQDKRSPPIAAEKLLSRDFALPFRPHVRESRSALTTPHAPQLHTATRADQRLPPVPVSHEQRKPAQDYSRPKVGGLTQPMTPQLETRRRAATHRRPVEVIDDDAEELAKKFHARPLNKHILEPKSYPRYSPAKPDSKARLTHRMAPKLPTSAVTRPQALQRAASVTAEMERHRKERERRLKARQAGSTTQPKSLPAPIHRPVIPETPPLKSIQLHREYQKNFRRKIEAEEEEKEKQRQFKANPMRVTAPPARFEGSTKPTTEVKPFELPGERYHEEARERLEQKRREEEVQCLKSSGIFRAKPMPVFESETVHVVHSTKPLTQTESPMLATKTRAAERAAFEAAEKERREREQAFCEQREQQERQLKEEEIKHLRRKEMIFHARPVPDVKPFQLKHDTRPLTEPASPTKRS